MYLNKIKTQYQTFIIMPLNWWDYKMMRDILHLISNTFVQILGFLDSLEIFI